MGEYNVELVLEVVGVFGGGGGDQGGVRQGQYPLLVLPRLHRPVLHHQLQLDYLLFKGGNLLIFEFEL